MGIYLFIFIMEHSMCGVNFVVIRWWYYEYCRPTYDHDNIVSKYDHFLAMWDMSIRLNVCIQPNVIVHKENMEMLSLRLKQCYDPILYCISLMIANRAKCK